MKSTKLFALTLASTLMLGAIVTTTVSAEKLPEAGSQGSFQFKTGGDTDPTPVDPTDNEVPPKPIKPLEPGKGGGTKGLLRFDRVPNLAFESVAVSNKTVVVNVLEEEYELVEAPANPDEQKFYAAPTVEISDLRGTNAGWHAQVAIDEKFVSTKNADDTVIGTVVFNTSHVAGYTGQEASLTPNLTNGLILSEGARTFINSTEGKGAFQWGVSFYTEDQANQGKPSANHTGTPRADSAITLSVPAGQKVEIGETYTSNLTWTLLTTPEM